MSTGLHGCFKTHPIPSAYPSPSTLAFPGQPSKPLHFLALLEGFSPSFLFFPSSPLFSSQKLSGEQRGQPLQWHSLLTSPWGEAQLPEVSGQESIPSWGQSPCELEGRQPQGWDRAHEFRRAPCWHHCWSSQEVLPSAFTQRVPRSHSAVSCRG